MVGQDRPQDGRPRVSAASAPEPAEVAEGAEAALIVVLSPATVAHVGQIAQAGWDGPVLAVGSVEEAQALLDAPAQARGERRDLRPASGRAHLAPAPDPSRRLSGLVLDPDRRKVVHAGRERTLTPLEFGVLEVLMQRPGQVHRFDELTRRVWGTSFTGDPAHLHAVVRRLRRKLEGVGAQVELVAVRGVGFRLTGLAPSDDPRAGRPDGQMAGPDVPHWAPAAPGVAATR